MGNMEKIAIVGSGLIGRSWAMIFASAGYQVVVFDIKQEQVNAALMDIKNQLDALTKSGLLRGTLTASEQMALITGTDQLAAACKDAVHVQECVPESAELRRKCLLQSPPLSMIAPSFARRPRASCRHSSLAS